MRATRRRAAARVGAWLLVLDCAVAQHTAAADDSSLDSIHSPNHFYARKPLNATEVDQLVFGVETSIEVGRSARCEQHSGLLNVQLAWTAKLGASVYSSPLIVQAAAAGSRSVWASTFVRYAESVDGIDGRESAGAWPYTFSHSTFHTGPLAFDVDADSIDEMLLLSFDAELIFLDRRGLPMRGRGLKLPKLKVSRRWFDEGGGARPAVSRTSHNLATHATEERGAAPARARGAERAASGAAGGGAAADDLSDFTDLFGVDEGDDDDEALFEADDGGEHEPRLASWAKLYDDPAALRALFAEGYVYIDAHVLSAPTLADVDGDGEVELVVGVSYFIEEAEQERLRRHGVEIDHNQYVAGAVVALDPVGGRVKWSTPLDLSTKSTKLRAYVYSSVSVADLDGDGALEVAVGTSMGFIYVLRATDGALRDGFPVQMNEVQAQVVPADVDGDGSLELIAADAAGSVAAWRADGSLLWEVQTSGLCAQGVTLTSSADGGAQLVVPTTAGVVHLLDGKTGREVAPFPLRTEGKILSAVTVVALGDAPLMLAPTRLAAAERGGEAHLVFASFDGYLHVVHKASGCTHRLDIGEHSYTQVLADDLTGNGRLDLLLSTMNGNLFCFETLTPAAPMRSWRSQGQGRNVFQQREGWQGVAIESGGRGGARALAVSGASFVLEFSVLDARRVPRSREHHVVVRLGRARALQRDLRLVRAGARRRGDAALPRGDPVPDRALRRPPHPHDDQRARPVL